MAVVIDLNLVCIICLQDDGGELVSVFANMGPDTQVDSERKITISEKISLCSNLNLADIKIKISNRICTSCLDDLSAAWRFRKNCEISNTLLLSIQEEEEDVVSLANYEHEIKQTSELRHCRDDSETKSYPTTPQMDDKDSDDIIKESNGDNSQDEGETFSGYGIVEYIDEDQKDFVESADYFDCVRDEILEEVDDDIEANKSTNIKEERYTKYRITKETNNLTTIILPEGCHDESSQVQIKQEMAEKAIEEDEIEQLSANMLNANKKKSDPEAQFQPKLLGDDDQEEVNEKENSENLTHSNITNSTMEPSTKAKRTSYIGNSSIKKPGTKKVTSQRGKSFHGSSKICDICGNIYKYQHALTAHMRRHNNDRQYGCELCDKAFVSNVELRRHMRVHTGQKPYPCSFCDRRFSDFGSRSKHERTHTGERPYRCTTCHKSFAYPHVLTVHLRTHTGEKKFQCTRCGRGFTKKAYLLAHLKKHARFENKSLITRLNDYESVDNTQLKDDANQQQEITAIKTVALEECIFTTELMNEQDNTSNCIVELEETIDEEHLEEETNNIEYILGARS